MSQNAKNTLIRMLSRRDYFTFEAKRKLLDKGFEPKEVAEAVKALSSYMDDECREEAFIVQQLARGYGPHVISQKMWQKGGKLMTLPSVSVQITAIQKFISKKGEGRDPRKIFADLMRRGFDIEAIKDALNM